VVALFFDDHSLPITNPDIETKLRCYIEAIREKFTAIYATQVEPIRPTLENIAKGKKQVGGWVDDHHHSLLLQLPTTIISD